MHTLIEPSFILILATLVFSADRAITASIVRDFVRVICYGIVALLALIYVVVSLLGLH